MTDPRIARIQAASRMPLPRLATDALADALKLVEAYAAEVTRLKSAPPPPPPPAPSIKESAATRQEMERMRKAVDRANRNAADTKAMAAEFEAQLQHAQAELAVWRATPMPDTKALRLEIDQSRRYIAALKADLDKAHAEIAVWRGVPEPIKVRRCKCGAPLGAAQRCNDCRRMRLKPLTCGCGAPMRKNSNRCRTCFVNGRFPPAVVQRATPMPRASQCACGVVLTPGRTVCRTCSKELYLAKNASTCIGCGIKLRDVDSRRCRNCYRARKFERKESHDQQTGTTSK